MIPFKVDGKFWALPFTWAKKESTNHTGMFFFVILFFFFNKCLNTWSCQYLTKGIHKRQQNMHINTIPIFLFLLTPPYQCILTLGRDQKKIFKPFLLFLKFPCPKDLKFWKNSCRGKIGVHNIFVIPELGWKPTSVYTIFLDLKPKLSCKSTSVNVYCVHRLLFT